MHIQRGFTLVELIIVIVLLGIVATISTQFVALSTQGAIDVGDRQQRALQGVVVSEQITRELREAFPLSVRAQVPGCLEWLPILGGTTYESLPFEEDETVLAITPFSDDALQAINNQEARLVVYGYGVPRSQLYNYDSGPGPVSPKVDSISSDGDVTLSSSHRFTQRSPQKRIYAIGRPVSICQNQNGVSKRLVRFGAYAATSAQPSFGDLSSTESGVMSADLWPGSLRFNVIPASLQRSALVDFSFELKVPSSDEKTRVSQEVQIRNVP